MGDLAVKYSSSFDDIVSEISSARTYAEQEQIYKGFIKLVEQQRELLVARRYLAARLKGSVQQEPLAVNSNKIKQPQLTEGKKQQKQKQLSTASELPMPEPQLPEIISTAEEEIKSKSQIATAAEKELHTEGITDRELPSLSSSSSDTTTITTTAAESLSTEIPSAKISSSKREGKAKAIDKRKLAKEKKKKKNR
jgi:hypothetical protein